MIDLKGRWRLAGKADAKADDYRSCGQRLLPLLLVPAGEVESLER